MAKTDCSVESCGRASSTFHPSYPEWGIGPQPAWRTKQDRLRAHLFIGGVYHRVYMLRTLLQRKDSHISWAGLCEHPSSWVRVTTTLTTVEGALISTHGTPAATPGSRRSHWRVGEDSPQRLQRWHS